LEPNRPLTFDIPVTGVRGPNGYAYLISARAAEGFVPRLFDSNARDDRNLGVQMQLKALVEP
jgi:hypothetical protein